MKVRYKHRCNITLVTFIQCILMHCVPKLLKSLRKVNVFIYNTIYNTNALKHIGFLKKNVCSLHHSCVMVTA